MLIILLILIFIRPFISSLAFPYLNSIYSNLFLGFLIIWAIIKKIPFRKIQISRKSPSAITLSDFRRGIGKCFILSCTIKYPLILLCFALIISVIFSGNKLNSLKELYKYIIALLLFLIAVSLSYEEKLRTLRIIIWAATFISLLAIYQYFFGFQHLLNYIAKAKITDPFVLDYVERKRIFFPFVTPNTLGGYLAMIIPLTLIHKHRIWFIIPLSFALLLTKSLGALLSIFLALVIYFYFQGKLEKRRIIFLFGLLIITGLVFITRITTQKQHLQPIFSTVMRLNYWKDTLIIIKAQFLTGVGLGNFNLTQSRYAHNSYLQIWAEMGILGLISFLWLIVSIFKYGLKSMRNSSYKNQVAILITANTVFLIHNLLDFSFFLPEVVYIWWLVLGMIIFKKGEYNNCNTNL